MKIPKNAKRVFKGVIYDVYHWRQKMFDGSYETYERLRRPNSVQILATQKNKILMAKEQQPAHKPFYGFFGGRVNPGEKPLQAAKRELAEETGLVSEDWELLSVYEPHYKVEWKIHWYAARNCEQKEKHKRESGEKIEIFSVTFENFLKITQRPEFRGSMMAYDLLKKMQNKKELTAFKKKLFPRRR